MNPIKITIIITTLLVLFISLTIAVVNFASPQRAHELLLIFLGLYLTFWFALYWFTKFSWSEIAVRCALTSGALLFSVSAAEVLALTGLVDYRLVFNTVSDEPWRNPVNLSDPELLHIRKPYSHFRGRQNAGDIAQYYDVKHTNNYYFDARYDRNGFRNERDLEKADIAVVGDSFIEAGQVSQSETMTSVLEGLQGRIVANLGQSWYGPQQELVVLKRHAVPLQPEVVVWAFYGGNDLFDFHRYEEQISSWPGLSREYHSLSKRSFTRNLLHAGLARLATRQLEPAPECLLTGSNGKDVSLYFHYTADPLLTSNGDTLERVLKIFSEANRVALENGFHLVVAYVPAKLEVYHDLCTFDRKLTYPGSVESRLSDRLALGLAQISESIGYIDLTPALRSAASQGQLVYFTDDTHWTPAGNAVVAREVSDYLSANL